MTKQKLSNTVSSRWFLLAIGLVLIAAFSVSGCKVKNKHKGKRVLNVPIMSSVASMDPITLRSLYDSVSSAQVTETLLEYHYLKRPLTLKPLLLKKMPTTSKDGLTYTFHLQKGILFHDNVCFKGGKGRELQAKDVFYSFKRMANRSHKPTPAGWWVYKDRIAGFNKYRDEQYKLTKKGKPFNFDLPVEGLKTIDKYTFSVRLVKPFPQFLFMLAFQKTAIVPRECVDYYNANNRGGFSQHPVGSGPFMFKRWIKGVSLEFVKNPNYSHGTYPTDGFMPSDIKEKRHLDKGAKLPMSDVLMIHIFRGETQPAWIKFDRENLDYITVATEYFPKLFDEKKNLKKAFTDKGVSAYAVHLLDFIYTGFNFKDKLVGGRGDKARFLRKALAHAIDYTEINKRFYNNESVVYQGVIPPGLPGYGGLRHKQNLEKAKEYLVKAGYPGGKGLPVLVISTSSSSLVKEREDMIKRQFAKIGVRVKYELSTFPQLSNKLRSGKTQMFSLAWGSDYPDGENNLQLFWGENAAPGPNSWFYDNPKFNALYVKIRTMFDSPERTTLYKEMNQILIEDVPFLGSMARTRRYIKHSRLQNFKPNETMSSYWKYLKVPVEKGSKPAAKKPAAKPAKAKVKPAKPAKPAAKPAKVEAKPAMKPAKVEAKPAMKPAKVEAKPAAKPAIR